MKDLAKRLQDATTRPPWIPDNYIEHQGIFYRPDQCKKVDGKMVPKNPCKQKTTVNPNGSSKTEIEL